ncbi:MAG: hypothetical protein Q8P57_03060 [Candidatus Pacearchaeota archaeon]|nr:hypothetical protein [Candidatus Pacearchaeota archaeon]
MSEKCKTCRKEFISGIWLAPQFIDEKVLLFCSNKCKNQHIKEKLDRIKWNYPGFYKKIMKSLKEGKRDKAIDEKLWDMILQSGKIQGKVGGEE